MAEETIYEEEGVAWTRIEYQDNQGCIDLIEKTPSGIMRLLDEACKKPNFSDRQLGESLASTHKRCDFYLEPRAAGHKAFRHDEAFVVRHFAGNVCYQVDGFLSKNNDTLGDDFLEAMMASPNPILGSVAGAPATAPTASSKKGGSFNSVSRRFINDLNQLMADLNATGAHFVRCIKPNMALMPAGFTPSLVLQQLRCSGTMDAVQLMARGYPTRIPFATIHQRYVSYMPAFVQGTDDLSRGKLKARVQIGAATQLVRLHPRSARADFTFALREGGAEWVLDPGGQVEWEAWEHSLKAAIGAAGGRQASADPMQRPAPGASPPASKRASAGGATSPKGAPTGGKPPATIPPLGLHSLREPSSNNRPSKQERPSQIFSGSI